MKKKLIAVTLIAIAACGSSASSAGHTVSSLDQRPLERLVNSDTLIERLRKIPSLPRILLEVAEKLYRLYKLNKIDSDLHEIREIGLLALRTLTSLVEKVENNEQRLLELEISVKHLQHEIDEWEAKLRPCYRKQMTR